MNGKAKIAGSISPSPSPSPAAATTYGDGSAGGGGEGWAFDGSLGLEGVRLNQLQLFRKLGGSLQVL